MTQGGGEDRESEGFKDRALGNPYSNRKKRGRGRVVSDTKSALR